jgi:hypothetical protein
MAKLSKTWSRKLILQLWIYSKSIWTSRNAVGHGRTEHTISKDLLLLHQAITQHYQKVQDDQHYVPSKSTHLFLWPLATMLTLWRITLSCWICSVEEAIWSWDYLNKHSNAPNKNFLQPRNAARQVNHRPLSRPKQFTLLQPPFSAAYHARQALLKPNPLSNTSSQHQRRAQRQPISQKAISRSTNKIQLKPQQPRSAPSITPPTRERPPLHPVDSSNCRQPVSTTTQLSSAQTKTTSRKVPSRVHRKKAES